MNKNQLIKSLGKKPLVIAEVGQNHQGSLELAKKYVEEFSKKELILNSRFEIIKNYFQRSL